MIRTIKDLKEFIKNFFKGEKVEVYLFGSRARGDNTPFSDIDLGFVSDRDISNRLAILRDILENSCLPYKVDIVDLSGDDELLKIVLQEGDRWI